MLGRSSIVALDTLISAPGAREAVVTSACCAMIFQGAGWFGRNSNVTMVGKK
jgi:hypothetical protein